jgi:predicted XRE-type DNA-binding protein
MRLIKRKRITGYPDYWIYEDGRVWSDKGRGRFLHRTLNKGGYLKVTLCDDGKIKTFTAHQLVAVHHVPGQAPELEVCHTDSDKLNNWAYNLRWDTRSANSADRVQANDHHLQKLRVEQVVHIVELLKNSSWTQKSISVSFGVCRKAISRINQGKSWAHVTEELVPTFPIRSTR